ncbi:unnamed protein product, partial [Amoebophrya sp. A25]
SRVYLIIFIVVSREKATLFPAISCNCVLVKRIFAVV